MSIRDLGYRPYDGERHPAEKNTWVILRHSLGRAWRSWIVKLTLLFSWVPVVGFIIATRVAGAFSGPGESFDPSGWLDALLHAQWLTAGFVLTLASGAGAIAYDLNHNGFAYFFSKPVTAAQYLIGRIGAVFVLTLMVTWLPCVLFSMAMIALNSGTPMDNLVAFGRATGGAALISLVMAAGTVGFSALSRSRAYTFSAWVLAFFVPWGLAGLVQGLMDWPWLRLAAIPMVLSDLVNAVCGHTDEEALVRWYHAAPVACAFVAGAIAVAYRRVRSIEVFS